MLDILEYGSKDEILKVNILSDPFFKKTVMPELLAHCIEDGEEIVTDLPYTTFSGKEMFLHLHMTKVKNEINSEEVIIAYVTDITSEKQFTEELKKTNKKYNTLFNNIQDVYCKTTTDGIILEISPSAYELSGYKREELLGKNYKFIFNNSNDGKLISEELKKNKIVHDRVVMIKRKDKKIKYCSFSLKLVNDTNNIVIIGILRDISERKKAEDNLKKTNENLVATNKQLKEIQKQLVQQEKLASIGQLAAGIAHEINNPAGFVMSNLRNFKEYMKDLEKLILHFNKIDNISSPNKLTEYISEIGEIKAEIDLEFLLEDTDELLEESIEGISRISDIVNNLRNFARQDQIQVFKKTDVNEVIKNTLKLVKNEIKYDAEVISDFAKLPRITANPNLLTQVFTNIFINAAQALRANKKDDQMGKIMINSSTSDRSVKLEITDDGPGIPSSIINKIYDPFFTTKEAGKGTGLGLNIAYDIIVNKHKGEIFCESEKDKGTKFIIKLPVD
jgi:PAS domain S-box-containing protein